jgi:hypothetical protein
MGGFSCVASEITAVDVANSGRATVSAYLFATQDFRRGTMQGEEWGTVFRLQGGIGGVFSSNSRILLCSREACPLTGCTASFFQCMQLGWAL